MVEPRKMGTAEVSVSPRRPSAIQGAFINLDLGSVSPSFVTPDASAITPQSSVRNLQQNIDTFGLKIFGTTPAKKTNAVKRMIEEKARRELEEAERRKKEDEDRKREEDEKAYAEVESDHHGRIFIDYRQPRPSIFPVSAH